MFSKTKTENTTKNLYTETPNGYLESIQKGLNAVRYFSNRMSFGTGEKGDRIPLLKREIDTADAIVIGAGAGLSISAGMFYSGERFKRYFFDFAEKYGVRDMYSGSFYPFPDEETRWAWWARNIYFNRYIGTPKPVYEELFSIVKDKDYFVITTNVDHLFQKSGFDKKRLFYTQGDYGLFQSIDPSNQKTYDNEKWVIAAMEAQGFVTGHDGLYHVPEDRKIAMRIPTELIPKCPDDGSEVTMNLRMDDSFVEDAGWHRASAAYAEVLHRNENSHVLYLELGVGANTPVIIKYPFWQKTLGNDKAVYACVNFGEAYCPAEIEDRSICIDSDIGEVLNQLQKLI